MELDRIVTWLFRETGARGPASPFAFIESLGIDLRPAAIGGACLFESCIYLDCSLSYERMRSLAMRELCRWLLRCHRLPDNVGHCVALGLRITEYSTRRAGLSVVASPASSPASSSGEAAFSSIRRDSQRPATTSQVLPAVLRVPELPLPHPST